MKLVYSVSGILHKMGSIEELRKQVQREILLIRVWRRIALQIDWEKWAQDKGLRKPVWPYIWLGGHQAINHLCSKHSGQRLLHTSLPLKRHPTCLILLVPLVLVYEHKDLHASYKSKLPGARDMAPQLTCLPYKQKDPSPILSPIYYRTKSQLQWHVSRVPETGRCLGPSRQVLWASQWLPFSESPVSKDKMGNGLGKYLSSTSDLNMNTYWAGTQVHTCTHKKEKEESEGGWEKKSYEQKVLDPRQIIDVTWLEKQGGDIEGEMTSPYYGNIRRTIKWEMTR